MASVRHDRVQAQIKEIASSIILFELKDPRLGFVTITRVDLSPDMRFAKIYYSVLGTNADIKLTAQAIQHARGHVQREVAKRLRRLRFAPILSFILDDSPRKAMELSHLIEEAVQEDESRRKGHETDEEAEDELEEESEAEGEDYEKE